MAMHDHGRAPSGGLYLGGGIALGVLLIVGLLTHGMGLFGDAKSEPEEIPLMIRQGDKIILPEGSALRDHLAVMPAGSESVRAKLVLPGIVEADPARTAAVLPPLGGRILELRVALGDRVASGQVLAVLDSPDLAQAYDDSDKAADLLRLTETNLRRQQEAFNVGGVAARDLDQAKSDHAQAAAEYARTQARLKVVGARADQNRGVRQLTVKAPVSGSITSLSVAPGNMINDPTQPMMTIADLSTVWVTALVPEKDVSLVAMDEDAEVSLAAYPDQPLHGKVQIISDVIEADSRRNKLRITFSNAAGMLKPNMFAAVTLLAPEKRQIVLPTSALLMNNDRTTVFVATAPWTFERRVVDTQLGEGTTVTINRGLAPGEQVVVKGGVLLND